jgi:TPP-dependent indolepyruvate ferredoxin oxidoreductase alpha subunit
MYSDWENCSELLKILSVFEQNYFIDKKYFKKYPYPITNQIIEKMVKTLERIAVDPKMRRAMEEEEFAALDVAFLQDVVARKNNALAQKDNALQKALAELNELKQRFGLN